MAPVETRSIEETSATEPAYDAQNSRKTPRTPEPTLEKNRPGSSQPDSSRMAGDSEQDNSASANERTGILGAERGGNKGYQTAGPADSIVQIEATGSEQTASIRKRKGKPRPAATEDRNNETNHSWWYEFWDKYGSVELENKGSVARDHLALERTFLAWLRTSLSFASIGIAVTQLFRLNTTIGGGGSPEIDHLKHVGKPLGATFIAIAILVLFIGFHRYFESQHYVIRGKFPASRASIVLVVLVSASLIAASLGVILVMARGTFD